MSSPRCSLPAAIVPVFGLVLAPCASFAGDWSHDAAGSSSPPPVRAQVTVGLAEAATSSRVTGGGLSLGGSVWWQPSPRWGLGVRALLANSLGSGFALAGLDVGVRLTRHLQLGVSALAGWWGPLFLGDAGQALGLVAPLRLEWLPGAESTAAQTQWTLGVELGPGLAHTSDTGALPAGVPPGTTWSGSLMAQVFVGWGLR